MKKIIKFLACILCFVVFCSAVVYGVKQFFPVHHDEAVTTCARKYGIEKEFIFAVIKAESNFNEEAVSKKEAIGLMQLMETTGEWVAEQLKEPFEKKDLYEPQTNIRFGCFYLSYLLELYHGDKVCALAAYNAGPANVDSWLLSQKYSKDGKTLDNIPFPETEKYIKQVLKFEKVYRYLYGEKNK